MTIFKDGFDIVTKVSKDIKDSKLIANPNCTTSIISLPLFEIYKNYGIKKVGMHCVWSNLRRGAWLAR